MATTSAAPSGSDISASGTVVGILQSELWYQLAVWVDKLSGTTSSPVGIAANAKPAVTTVVGSHKTQSRTPHTCTTASSVMRATLTSSHCGRIYWAYHRRSS
jgi:hypothetical protein